MRTYLGLWSDSRSVKGVGSYIGKHVRARPGVYRLIAMADMNTRTPMRLSRIAGCDTTGTLYVGCGRSVRARVQQLVRSLRVPRHGWNTNEHSVGPTIRGNRYLKEMFPRECLAVRWSYDSHPELFEKNLLGLYQECFAEIPPLNVVRGHTWFDIPVEA